MPLILLEYLFQVKNIPFSKRQCKIIGFISKHHPPSCQQTSAHELAAYSVKHCLQIFEIVLNRY